MEANYTCILLLPFCSIPLSSLPAQWGLPTAPKSGLHYICSTLDVTAIAPSPQNPKTFERKDNLILD